MGVAVAKNVYTGERTSSPGWSWMASNIDYKAGGKINIIIIMNTQE